MSSESESEFTPPKRFSREHPRLFYIGHISVVVILLIWPWIFLAAVWGHRSKGGLQASSRISRIAQNDPHNVDFFVTTVARIIVLIMTYAYATAITYFSENWHNSFPPVLDRFYAHWKILKVDWGMTRRAHENFRFLCVLGLYTIISLFTVSGLTAILIPHPFTRHVGLQGTEIDFSSTDPDCSTWINNNQIPDICNWQDYNGFQFTNCLSENQLEDAFESGRSNMKARVPGNTEAFTYTQLDGLQFLGPINGVLPLGPNGIPAFNNTLDPLHWPGFGSAITYNYSLQLQGVSSGVRCQYDPSTPITTYFFTSAVNPNLTLPHYNATCPTGTAVYDMQPYSIPYGLNNTLGAWACTTGDSYTVYFRGDGNYIDAIGNMSCVMPSVQFAAFSTQYSLLDRSFDTQLVQQPVSAPSNGSSQLLDRAVYAITDVVGQAQGLVSNLVAESVITYGIKYFGISQSAIYNQSDAYLRLYEAMIEGIFQYEATYIRLIYSTYPSPPRSCKRPVVGSVEYQVVGWQADSKTAAFLIPLTLLNLTSLTLFILAMDIALRRKPQTGELERQESPQTDSKAGEFSTSL